MPQSHISKFKPVHALRLSCSWCEGPMFLTQIDRVKPGYDIRTYECAECGNSVTGSSQYETAA
jgi:hypothetical protein